MLITLSTFVAGPQIAGARTSDGHGSRVVAFTLTSEIVGGDVGCDPSDPTRCAATFRNLQTLQGDFAGTAYQVGSAVLLPGGTYQGQSVSTFAGTIEGCGAGTAVIVETGMLDPATGDSWGTWTITRGQGTGDLAQLSGAGSGDTRVSDEITGTIRCH